MTKHYITNVFTPDIGEMADTRLMLRLRLQYTDKRMSWVAPIQSYLQLSLERLCKFFMFPKARVWERRDLQLMQTRA